MSRRNGLNSAGDSPSTSLPSNRARPDRAFTRPTMARPSVVLPEPLSPTRPIVSPAHQCQRGIQDRIDKGIAHPSEPRPNGAHEPESDAEVGNFQQRGPFMRAGAGE